MLKQIFSSLAEFAGAIIRGFLIPGDLLLSALSWIAPKTAQILAFGNGKTIVLFILALLGWTLVLVAGLMLSRLCRNIAWQVSALFRVFVHRSKQFAGDLKTRLIWKYREYFPHKEAETHSVSQDEFDELDIAVLASISRRGSGMATTATGLAEKYRMQTAQVQERLDRLQESHMLRSAVSPNDGHQKYRLTDTGLAYIAMCERQAAARVNPASASVPG